MLPPNPLLTCVSTVVNTLAWQCLLGAGSLGVWFSALHEIPYFIMMELLFLLPCDFFFFEVKFNLCVYSVRPSECLHVSHSTPSLNS